MVPTRICILLLGLFALTGSIVTAAVGGSVVDNDVADSKFRGQAPVSEPPANGLVNDGLIDDDDDDGNGLDPESKIEGIPIKYLTIDEVYQVADESDVIDGAKWDILVAEKVTLERSNQPLANQGSRKKRWISLAGRLLFSAGRTLFRGSRAGRLTTSGSRLTRQYNKPGSYKDAVRDFNRFKPDNVKSFDGKISGKSGTFGKHKLTVRDGSKNGGPPTLDVRSPRGDGSTYVRKFRYGDKQ